MAWKFSSIETIQAELNANPQSFTAWFKPAFEKLLFNGTKFRAIKTMTKKLLIMK
jgi:hypothetical protein